MSNSNRPQLYLHVGMGKTGTSSIQAALSRNEISRNLSKQNSTYLGMYFDFIDKSLGRDYRSFEMLLSRPQAQLEEFGAALAEYISAQFKLNGNNKFIFSNEMLNGYSAAMQPIIRHLVSSGIEVKIVLFIRQPIQWLSSAYNQWGVYHKDYEGRLQSFGARSRKLIRQYHSALSWLDIYGSLCIVGLSGRGHDAVCDFGNILGLNLEQIDQRILESPEKAELVLRAIFADSVQSSLLPQQFDAATGVRRMDRSVSVASICEKIFDRTEASKIARENRDVLERIWTAAGLHGLDLEMASEGPPDPEVLQRRLMDYLLWIVLDQAQRIRRLEQKEN